MAESLEQLEIEKRRLECDKLRAEIAEASIAWWKRPGYLGGLAPVLIAVVGFFSVWSTGFFDTQRATLKTEVEGLKAQQAELQKANAEAQRRIDDAYISLKMASADTAYAVSHFQSLPVGDDPLGKAIVEASEDGLKQLTISLEGIPASKWAAELQPIIGPRPGLRAPDGRLYSPVDRKYYVKEEDLPGRK